MIPYSGLSKVQRRRNGLWGTVLLPQLQTLADDGVSLLGDFTSGLAEASGDFDKITVVLGETVGGIANLILGSLPQFVQVGMSIVSAIGGALAANLPVLISSASSIVMTLLQGVITALPQFTDGAVQLITTLAEGIVDNLPRAGRSSDPHGMEDVKQADSERNPDQCGRWCDRCADESTE